MPPRGGSAIDRRPAQPNPVAEGHVRGVLLALALPVLGQEMLNTIVGLVDTFLAGRISVEATIAVGLAAYVAWLATMLFGLVATGTTAVVARCFGAGERSLANRVANQSLTLGGTVGVGGCVLMYLMAPQFAAWQGMTDAAYDIVVRYLQFEAAGYLATSITLVGAAALRGAGDTRTPMKVLGLVNILNMIVSPLLVYGLGPLPALGVDGIVMGTVAARYLGCATMLLALFQGRAGLRIDRSLARVDAKTAWRVFRVGLPAALDGALTWTGHFIFLAMIKRLAEGAESDVIYAAHIVVIRVEAFTYLPASAWAAACGAMIGQALGAKDAPRARRTGHEAVGQCVLLTSVIAVIYYLGAEAIFRLMHAQSAVHTVGIPALRLSAFFQPMLAASIVYVGALRGAGDTRWPLMVTLATLVLVRLPLGYLLGFALGYGFMGAWAALCTDMSARALLAWLVYVRGRWLRTAV